MSEPLLGNMQNPFDALFGDVVGENDGRFFIIEFKRTRDGFKAEISKNGKEDRRNLYEHLREDKDCTDLAFVGHFGGYPTESNQLAFEPYAQCMLPDVSRREQLISALLSQQSRPVEPRRYKLDFASLYQNLTVSHSVPPVLPNGFFSSGLGLTKDQLEKYVACMYQHLESSEDKNGQAMLGRVDAATGKFSAVTKPIPELVQDLHKHFAEMRNALTPQPPAPGKRDLIE